MENVRRCFSTSELFSSADEKTLFTCSCLSPTALLLIKFLHKGKEDRLSGYVEKAAKISFFWELPKGLFFRCSTFLTILIYHR